MPYPISSQQDVIDGLNYVLSGPGGLGQDFAWFNSNGRSQYDLTGNYRIPFTQINYNDPGVPSINIYVAPIALSTAEMLDERTWKFTFATPEATPPFVVGQPITVTGVADPYYDGTYSPIGVTECTLTYVVARTNNSYALVAASTGGTVELNSMNSLLSTDCNARVTVTSPQQAVIISSQLNNQLIADSAYTGSYYYIVTINRYKAINNNDPTNPDFVFVEDAGIDRPNPQLAYKEVLIATTLLEHGSSQETIFTSIIDQPGPGYYWYILELEFIDNSGGNIVTNCLLTQRSFSAQVFKP